MKKIALLGGIVALGLFTGGAALAHGGDDHGEFHEELGEVHELDHEQLGIQHQQFHARAWARYRWMISRCGGDPRCEWMVTRRERRRHRLEHWREARQHDASHNELSQEHDSYHGYDSPYYGAPSVIPTPRRIYGGGGGYRNDRRYGGW